MYHIKCCAANRKVTRTFASLLLRRCRVLQIIGLAVSFAGVAVVASLLSGLYRQLVGQPGG
jgi:hypothetical protein